MTVVLVTGAGGLIGSEASETYLKRGWDVVGIDNNSRARFFGPDGCIAKTLTDLEKRYEKFDYFNVDIKDFKAVKHVISKTYPDIVIHCAAQPSHDKAASIPFDDFDTNARGTLNMLEAVRQTNVTIPFVHVSTNKVYGDTPNRLRLVEGVTRYACADEKYSDGIDETMSVDNCTHSLFGASKLSGDVMAQEYGRYFGMKTGIFRGGCLTGSRHASVKLHGFLSYIVKCAVSKKPYTIIGYKGKQVRDQIHSSDVISAFDTFINNPDCGEVYNLGGEMRNSASVLDIVSMIKFRYGIEMQTSYDQVPRIGDHIWYVSSMKKFKNRYPSWSIKMTLPEIIDQIYDCEKRANP